jgi:hypothetical protein
MPREAPITNATGFVLAMFNDCQCNDQNITEVSID